MFFFNVLLAFLIGFAAAFAELLSRYSDPKKIFSTYPSWVYLFINAGTSALVYYLLVEFKWLEGTNESMRVLAAGTSAMAILRSSFASIKIGGKQVEAGLASILQVFLNWADRAFDQYRSSSNLTEVKRIMTNVDFKKAMTALPTTCFNSMKSVPDDEQKRVGTDLVALSENDDLDDTTKAINLGSILADVTGLQLLDKAKSTLFDSIKKDENDQGQETDRKELLRKQLTQRLAEARNPA